MHNSRSATAAAVLLLVLLPACAGWQGKVNVGLRGVHETAKLLGDAGHGLLHERCMAIANKCGQESPGVCPALKVCQAEKAAFDGKVIAIQRLVLLGLLAEKLEEQESAEMYFAQVLGMLKQLREAARAGGVL